MKRFNKSLMFGWSSRLMVSTLVLSLVSFGFTPPVTARAATAPDLGVAAGYSVFGNAGITETVAQLSHLWGNAGGNGFGHANLIASQVDGTIDAGANAPVVGAISTAYGDLAGEAQTGAINLATSPTVTPGVYDIAATAFSSTLTLDGAGVYIFRSTSSIGQTAGGTMLLTNGATACNVYWQIPTSMTFAAAGNIAGTIITNTGLISFVSGVNLQGRAWAATQVTMDNNQITEPICTVPPPAPVPGYSGGGTTFALIPNINVTKIPSPLALPLGPGPVTYDYKVTNIGQVPMIDVWVKDDKCSPVEYVSGDANSDSKLDMSESWTYRCTKTASKTETNTALAHGSYSGWNTYDNAVATVVVGVPIVPPLIHLLKTADKYSLPAGGGQVTYSYAVTNPGIAPLSDVSITDDRCTGLPGRVIGQPGDLNQNNLLENNETWRFTCQTNITQTTTNTGTAVGYANSLIAIDYSPITVVVPPATLTTAPKLPNTGLPPRETSNPWNIAALAGVLMFTSGSLVAVLKKRAI